MRGRSLLSLAVLVLLCCAPQLLGADQEKATVFRIGKPERLGVIVELAAPPLLESRGTRDLRVASSGLDALTSQLAEDLARIEGEVPGRIAAQASDAGAIRHTYRMTFAGASATVSRQSLAAIRALPYVKAVHEDARVEAYLSKSVPHIGAPQVWQQSGARGKGIVVAVIDTGINYRHWGLGEGFGPGFKVAGGYDFVNDDADPMDDNGHGTHVAGIVAANHKSLTGVAPEATLLAYKVLSQSGGGFTSGVLAGIERAIDPNGDGDPSDHADVVNMSLGGQAQPDDPLIAAVERGTAAGVVFSLAAGNAGHLGGLGSPGLAPSAITVAASDLDERIAVFSSGGPVGGTWALKPEITAPGVKIVSSYLGDRTFSGSGTSMAAPHVAGVAALLLERHPGWTPQDVKAAIVSTSKPIQGRLDKDGDVVTYAGSGRIDAPGAMSATIFPSPIAATFGLARRRNEYTDGTTAVTLTNRGATSETLTLQPPAMPAGVKLTVVPESVTLAPGASALVEMTLEAAASAVPNDSDIALSGVLTFAGAKTSVRVPWTLLQADVLQVTVGGADEFDLYISDGPYRAATWPEGPRTFAALLPYYAGSDVLVLFHPADGSDPRLVFREAQVVEGLTEITVSPEEAVYTVRVEGVDERGVPLQAISPDAEAAVWHRFGLPSSGLIELHYQEGRRSLRVSPFRMTRIQTYARAASGAHRYFAAYRHLKRIKQDETLTIGASDWASQKIRPVCPSDCTVAIGAGLHSYYQVDFHELPAGMDELTLHITPRADPQYDFRAHLLLVEKNAEYPRKFDPWTFVSSALRNVGGRFSTSTLDYVSKAEYFPPDPDTPLVLGDGPFVLRMSAGKYGLVLAPHGTGVQFHGGDVARSLRVEVQRLDEGPRGIFSPTDDPFVYDAFLQTGLFRLTTSGAFTIAGRPGRLTQTSVYDRRISMDGPPTLTFMRVENGHGAASTTVAAASPSRLVFAARQSTLGFSSITVAHERVNAAETKAWWRPHGTAAWLPLHVDTTGEDYQYRSQFPGSVGTLFSASLVPAVAAEGAVDLKLSVTNLLGGTTEAVYEPAFFVEPRGTRRRPMR